METPSQDQTLSQPYPFFGEEHQTIFDALNEPQTRFFKLSALLFYLLAYFYAAIFVDNQPLYFFPVAIGLAVLTERLIRSLKTPDLQIEKLSSRLETGLFLFMLVAQALALSIWGLHQQLEFFQLLTIHITFTFYILARTDRLSQGRLGIMVWLDAIQAFCLLPFKHFMSAIIIFTKTSKAADYTEERPSSKGMQQITILVASLLISGLLVFFVWSQLSQVSESFAVLFSNIAAFADQLLTLLFSSLDLSIITLRICLALPVSLYLYGLIAGSLLGKKNKQSNYQIFQNKLEPMRVVPNFAAYIIIGSLCLTYALFFLTGLSELGQLLSAGTAVQSISPQSASTVAVAGFWQLVRVSLLNFAVLGGFYLLAKKPLWDQRGTRLATTILFIFAALLALLAGWKLFGIYIYLYGPTPLRLISAWFILVLLVWCILTLIRFYKPIQAIRIGLFYALISFTLLCYLYPMLLPVAK